MTSVPRCPVTVADEKPSRFNRLRLMWPGPLPQAQPPEHVRPAPSRLTR